MSLLAFLRRTPSAALVGVQLLGVVLYALMESSPRGRALFALFGVLVLGFALRVVRSGPWLTWIGVALAVPIVVLTIVGVFTPNPAIATTSAALYAAFYLYAAGSLI
ncbi:MAG: two pore domain potassium channel family protein, partial [Gemmatimonas sp.]